MFTKETTFPAINWRSTYFVPENLNSSVDHADTLKRFILSNPDVHTIIPGMRQIGNVVTNTAASDLAGLAPELLRELKDHCWDRTPTE